MLGKNPKRSPIFGNGEMLEVKNIFKTIQGEGPLVGMPAIFIRLGGCNLACSFCDTNFERFEAISLEQIITQVTDLSRNEQNNSVIKLIVITGGEPLRQPIESLCQKLIELRFIVQIETNGTLYRELPKEALIVCSPKVRNGKYYNIREDLLAKLSAIKFLISQNLAPYNNIVELGQTKYNIPIFIQPMDEGDVIINIKNTELAINLSIENNYRLSIQTHKILNIE